MDDEAGRKYKEMFVDQEEKELKEQENMNNKNPA